MGRRRPQASACPRADLINVAPCAPRSDDIFSYEDRHREGTPGRRSDHPLAPGRQASLNQLSSYSGIGLTLELSLCPGTPCLFPYARLARGGHEFSRPRASWSVGCARRILHVTGTDGKTKSQTIFASYTSPKGFPFWGVLARPLFGRETHARRYGQDASHQTAQR